MKKFSYSSSLALAKGYSQLALGVNRALKRQIFKNKKNVFHKNRRQNKQNAAAPLHNTTIGNKQTKKLQSQNFH